MKDKTTISLAQHPEQLKAYKQHLIENQKELLLFDNQTFARNLEVGFWEMWEDKQTSISQKSTNILE